MQMASQRAFNQGSGAGGQRPAKDVRAETIKAIHATWRKVARGVDVNDKDEMRTARLRFCEKALGLRRTLKSMGSLSGAQLGRVLDEMRRLERTPGLPGMPSVGSPNVSEGLFGNGALPDGRASDTGAEIHHLATKAQTEAIDKLFTFLGWSAIGIQGFVTSKYKKHSHRVLTPQEAQSCTYILLRIAAQRSIKESRHVERVSNVMIREEIPRLKVRLGIDVRKLNIPNTEGEFDG
jgi:hypothetical protein